MKVNSSPLNQRRQQQVPHVANGNGAAGNIRFRGGGGGNAVDQRGGSVVSSSSGLELASLPSPSSTKTSAAAALRGGANDEDAGRITGKATSYGPMLLGQLIIIALNAFGYIVSLISPDSHYHVDLIGTSAFAWSTIPGFVLCKQQRRSDGSYPGSSATWSKHIRCSSFAVAAWSIKLASFLFLRILASKHDDRLQLHDSSWSAGFWFTSAAWGLITSLPYSLALVAPPASKTTATGTSQPVWSFFLYFGLGLFVLGFLIETLADYQKWSFKQQQQKEVEPLDQQHPKFCSGGLWSMSQHPNWFGDMLLWVGILVMNVPVLIHEPATSSGVLYLIRKYARLVFAAMSPLFLFNLFHMQATGYLLGETLEGNKIKYGYGVDPSYTDYVDNTPLIFPNPFLNY